jgi:amino acid transporter
LLLLPVGYVYGQWVERLPDTAGEAAYAAVVFAPGVSYFTGWMMLLAYFIVCPWEAVAVGKVVAYIFPWLDRVELYRVAAHPVFLPRLALGAGLTIFLCVLNYRGIRLSANFQKVMTSSVLLLFVVIIALSWSHGNRANLHPRFAGPPLISILLTLQIVPYFMTGFESAPKYAEEANPQFHGTRYMTAIAMALGAGAFFYALAVLAVAYVEPWQGLLGRRFATAIAFEGALKAPWPVDVILVMGVLGLFQCFNGNFAAATRLLFAFGRRGTIAPRFAVVHEKFLTPSNAVIAVTVATLAGLALGDALLVPVTEVGSLASATGWLMASASFFLVEKRGAPRVVAAVATLVSLLLMAMKLLPVFPGHFTWAEWLALVLWLVVGIGLRRRPAERVEQAKAGAFGSD